MNRKIACAWTVTLLLGFGSAWAQDEGNNDESEVTIRLMNAADAELPNAVTEQIALPESLREDSGAVKGAQFGIGTANENGRRREEGLTTAEEARDRAAEMAEEAQENRENRGRSDDPPGPPDDVPGPPDVPQPPTD